MEHHDELSVHTFDTKPIKTKKKKYKIFIFRFKFKI